MEYRQLGRSGLEVPELSYGTATFKGAGEFFAAFGSSDAREARRLVDICLHHGLNLFDSADTYSSGGAEEVLGEAIHGRRDEVLISTKTGQPMDAGPNGAGASRARLVKACDASLRRLGTDYIDIYYLHAFDGRTPLEETMGALADLVHQGKVRYAGVSNFAGWQLMKASAVAKEFQGLRLVSQQSYYSLIGRDYEWELMPCGVDQGIGAHVWSPLGWGRLTGKIRRDSPLPELSRLHVTETLGPEVGDERLFAAVDVLDEVAEETEKTIPQVAINWLLRRPSVSSVIIGARNEQQLLDNLGAVGWSLSAEQVARLDAATADPPPYPQVAYHRFEGFRRLSPPLVGNGSTPPSNENSPEEKIGHQE